MTWSKMLAVVGVALLALTASTTPASAHMKLIEPAARNQPTNLASDSCCAAGGRRAPKIENYQCEMGDAKTTTRTSATGRVMHEGRGYTLSVHLAVNHLGRVYHGVEDYANTYPNTNGVNTYLSLTDVSITSSNVGTYSSQNPYVLTLGTACDNCGWWAWYDTETATGGEMGTTWTSCADVTIIPVHFPLSYSTNEDGSASTAFPETTYDTVAPALTPPTMTGQFYVNTPMPNILQDNGGTLPANENEIADVRYTLLCPTGVTSPQCDVQVVDDTPAPFGTSGAQAYNADILPNGEYTVQSLVYFKLRDRADQELNRYRTYLTRFVVARDINCGNPDQTETGTATPYQCDSTTYIAKTADPSTLNCGQTPCTPTICCDLLQTCDLYVGTGCTAGQNTPITNPAGVTCAAATCTVTECCTPNQVCGVGGYLCPTSDIRPLPNIAGHVCASLTCQTDECCQPNETCDDYTCQSGLYHPNPAVPLTTVCNSNGLCSPAECCTPNPRCDSYDCPPLAATKVPNAANVICLTDTCTQSECCGDNQRCSATMLSPLCIAGSHTMKQGDPAAIQCQAPLCVVDDCCDPNPLCSSFACPPDAVQPIAAAATTVCTTDLCQPTECCIPNPVCSTHTCPQGQTSRPDSDRITCATTSCVDDECCVPNQTCDQYGGCAVGTMQPRQDMAAATITCTALLCTSQDCCEPNPRCDGYACPPLMEAPLPSPELITCALTGGPGSGCLDSECCAPNPTCGAFDCAGSVSVDSVFVDPADKAARQCATATCTTTDCCELAFTCGNMMGVRPDLSPPRAFVCGSRGRVANFDTTVCAAARCDVDTCCVSVGGIIPLTGPTTIGVPIIPPGGGVSITTPTGTTVTVGTTSPPPGTTSPPTTTDPTVPTITTGSGTNAAANGPVSAPVNSAPPSSDDDDDSGTVIGIVVVLLLLCCLLLAGLLWRNKRRSSSKLLEFAGTYRDVVAAAAHDSGLKGVGGMDEDALKMPTDREVVEEMAIASSSESESEPSIVSSSESETEPEAESSSEEEVEAPASTRPGMPAPIMKKKKAAAPTGAAPKLKKKPQLPAPKLKRGPKGAAPVLQKKVIAVGAGQAAPPPAPKVAVGAGGGGQTAKPPAVAVVAAGGGGGEAPPTMSVGVGAGGGGGGAQEVPEAPAMPAVPRPSIRRHKGQGRAGRGGRTASVAYSVAEVKNISAPICNTVVPVMNAEFMDLIKSVNKNKDHSKEAAMTHDGTNVKDRSQTIG